jgi:hypothetical protein
MPDSVSTPSTTHGASGPSFVTLAPVLPSPRADPPSYFKASSLVRTRSRRRRRIALRTDSESPSHATPITRVSKPDVHDLSSATSAPTASGSDAFQTSPRGTSASDGLDLARVYPDLHRALAAPAPQAVVVDSHNTTHRARSGPPSGGNLTLALAAHGIAVQNPTAEVPAACQYTDPVLAERGRHRFGSERTSRSASAPRLGPKHVVASLAHTVPVPKIRVTQHYHSDSDNIALGQQRRPSRTSPSDHLSEMNFLHLDDSDCDDGDLVPLSFPPPPTYDVSPHSIARRQV